MADYHHIYESAEKEDTEWDAIQRRLGNLPPRPEKKPPSKFEPAAETKLDASYLDEREDEDELDDLEDEFDDDRFLEAYRQKRLAELSQKRQQRTEFGTVSEIRGGEFIKEVTDASERGWVVVLLFQPRHLKCEDLEKCLDELAGDYQCTKFVKILSEECIPGYPRENLPTLLVYHERSCKKTLVGLSSFRQGRATTENVMEALNAVGPVCL